MVQLTGETVAQPGDVFLLHAGNYGGRITFTKPGTASGYIVWKAAGDGEALFAGIDVAASYVWLEGLTLRDQPFALMSKNAPTGIVISRCSFFNNHYSIYLQRGGSYWYIADNTVVGDTPYSTESFDGVAGGQMWDFGSNVKDWRSDFNNDGFDWGSSTAPFRYGGVVYSTVANLAAASGLETRGRQISRATCFATFNVPGPAPVPIPPQQMTLKAGCGAVDAGAILPNINDGFLDTAPDLGAFELGQPAPTYGPRPATPPPPTAPTAPTGLRITG